MEKDNTKDFSKLIYEKRKEKNLTQKDIAEELFITEQAVSKWERGLGYPDISLLPKLAEILNVSAEDLIYGKLRRKKSLAVTEEETTGVVETLEKYKSKKMKEESLKIFFLVITVASIIALAAVIIINLAIDGKLTWSLYVIGGIILVFSTLLPIIFLKGIKKAYLSVLTFCILSIPYVYLVAFITKTNYWVKPLVFPLIAVTAVFAVVIIFLSTKIKVSIFISMGINFFLSGVVLNFIVNKIVNNYLENSLNYPLESNFVQTIIMASFAFVSILLLVFGFIQWIFRNKLSTSA